MTLKNAKHHDGFRFQIYVLSWVLQLFCCFQLHGTTKCVVVVDAGEKRSKRVFFKDWVLLLFLCLGFFNEGSYIFNWLNYVHNPKITSNAKLQIQLCAFAIAVDFIKR